MIILLIERAERFARFFLLCLSFFTAKARRHKSFDDYSYEREARAN